MGRLFIMKVDKDRVFTANAKDEAEARAAFAMYVRTTPTGSVIRQAYEKWILGGRKLEEAKKEASQ